MDDRNIILVLGQQGQGKSLWTKEYVRDLPRLAVWDPKRSYQVLYPMDLCAWYEDVHKPGAPFKIGGYYPESAEHLASIAQAEQQTCLVLEECALLFAPRAPLDDWAREPIYTGRERGVTVIAVSQRPSSINIALRSQASRVVTFRQREARDLDFVGEMFDPDEVLNLPRLHCLDFDVDSQVITRYAVKLPSKLLPKGNTHPPQPAPITDSTPLDSPHDATLS